MEAAVAHASPLSTRRWDDARGTRSRAASHIHSLSVWPREEVRHVHPRRGPKKEELEQGTKPTMQIHCHRDEDTVVINQLAYYVVSANCDAIGAFLVGPSQLPALVRLKVLFGSGRDGINTHFRRHKGGRLGGTGNDDIATNCGVGTRREGRVFDRWVGIEGQVEGFGARVTPDHMEALRLNL